MRRTGWLAAWPASLVFGVASIALARRNPDYAFAQSSLQIAAELIAGYALIGSGLILARGDQTRAAGTLLALGGCAWFLLEWNNPGVGSSLVFTVGLVCYAAAPPLIAHALLTYPRGRPGPAERVATATAYAGSLFALGLLSALVYNPAAEGCHQCPANLLLVHGSPSAYRLLNRVGVDLGLVWAVLVVALLAWRLARSSVAARRLVGPALATGGAYLALVAVDFAASLHRGYLANDPIDLRLRLWQAVALTLLALALGWSWLRGRRTRARLARLVVDLAAAPAPGALEQALARSLGDPGLQLAYPLADGRYVDAEGRQVARLKESTALAHDGIEVAMLSHKPGLLDDPGLVQALTTTTSLALDHERLRAQLLAHLADLRSSRARIVLTADQERRRLERDLHDGAQQRLVTLTIALRLARTELLADPDCDRTLVDRVEQADGELRAALSELRALANGIFPAVLADEGLAAAVQSLAEERPGRIRVSDLPAQRLDSAVESAAYRLIVQAINHEDDDSVEIVARIDDGLLVIELEGAQAPGDLGDLEDRVGALGGTLDVFHAAGGHARIRAEIPCVS
jgi:signal transduction histidine kinase